MATPLKRALCFLAAALLLRASPALSVPIASGVNQPPSTADGPDYAPAPDDAAQAADGSDTGTNASARIVDPQVVAYGPGGKDSEVSASRSPFGASGNASIGASGSSHAPGWLLPAAVVGAGGGTLFALLSHGGKKSSNAGSNASGLDAIAGNSPGVSVGLGHGDTGNGTPSTVPEPGTLLLMGIGAAAFLARRSGMRA